MIDVNPIAILAFLCIDELGLVIVVEELSMSSGAENKRYEVMKLRVIRCKMD
jgi:hypothetical protein